MFVNVTTMSAQHAHARMIAIIVEKYDLSLDFFQQLYMYIYIYAGFHSVSLGLLKHLAASFRLPYQAEHYVCSNFARVELVAYEI